DLSVRLVAATTVTGNRLSADHGRAALEAGGAIAWQVADAGTTFDATSSGDQVTLGTVTTGGTQTITALRDVSFTQLTAQAGDVKLLSVAGSVHGGSISANGIDILGQAVIFDRLMTRADATVDAYGDIHGHDVDVGGTFSATAGLPPSTAG